MQVENTLFSTYSRLNYLYRGMIILIMEGKELKKIRKELNLTQTELADILGVKMNTVYRWESGILDVPKYIELAMQTVKSQKKISN